MRLCIVIKSEAFRGSAGMRIRYDRFAECLTDDATIEAKTCAELARGSRLDHDAYVFCKTFDLESLLFARRVRAAGRIVAQDLFDDYFSQGADPRLEPYRDWLRAMAPVTDYAICSTPRMVEVLRPFLPEIPIVPIDDPVIGYDPLAVAALSEAKARRAAAARTLEVAWFGIGDNPYFSVGIADLAAFEGELARIERRGWRVRLTLVTNDRPFEDAGLAHLRAFGIEHEVIAWSEAAERAALIAATVAILPVNAQAFSRAKSLNRAITALNAGCQVLSLGYPLYDRLDEFLYRSADTLIDDLETGACRVRAPRITALTARLASLANPFDAAAAFVGEARRAAAARAIDPAPRSLVGLVHGRQSAIRAHKAVGALAGISIASPFCHAGWNFGVRFDVAGGRLRMRTSVALAERYGLVTTDDPARPVRIRDLDFVEIDQAGLGVPPLRIFQPLPSSAIADIAVYGDVLGAIARCCRAAFGAIDLLLSDDHPLGPSLHALGLAA